MDQLDHARRAQEWHRLHDELRSLFSSAGREDPFGEGDFWVVDDDWGDRSQKVVIHNLAILSPGLVRQVQALLRGVGSDWRVVIQLELARDGYPAPEGITVRADDVEEAWNRDVLRQKFGAAFHW